MLIVYASKTGNIERFVKKTGITSVLKIIDGSEIISEDFILLTYTTGIGEVPTEVSTFMKNNFSKCKGLIGSGNKNWGSSFCNAVTLLHSQYNIPILMRFEMSGNKHDIEKFLSFYKKF
jgi:protein involved in ribonucleotide reduction